MDMDNYTKDELIEHTISIISKLMINPFSRYDSPTIFDEEVSETSQLAQLINKHEDLFEYVDSYLLMTKTIFKFIYMVADELKITHDDVDMSKLVSMHDPALTILMDVVLKSNDQLVIDSIKPKDESMKMYISYLLKLSNYDLHIYKSLIDDLVKNDFNYIQTTNVYKKSLGQIDD